MWLVFWPICTLFAIGDHGHVAKSALTIFENERIIFTVDHIDTTTTHSFRRDFNQRFMVSKTGERVRYLGCFNFFQPMGQVDVMYGRWGGWWAFDVYLSLTLWIVILATWVVLLRQLARKHWPEKRAKRARKTSY